MLASQWGEHSEENFAHLFTLPLKKLLETDATQLTDYREVSVLWLTFQGNVKDANNVEAY